MMKAKQKPFLRIAVESPCKIGLYQNGVIAVAPFAACENVLVKPKKKLEVPETPKLLCLDALSWSRIDEIGRNRQARDYFELGAIKHDIMKDGSVRAWRITDFDHDDLEDGSKAPISWILDSVYKRVPFDERDDFSGGYEHSQYRNYLNGDFTHEVSDELLSIVKPARKAVLNSFVTDYFWPYSEQEIFGRKVYAKQAEGHWYAYFAQENVSYVAFDEDGNPVWWWLRSPFCNISYSFCFVCGSGSRYYFYATYSGGVRPGFCS